MKTQTVRVEVCGGIAEAVEVPAGIVVNIHDYDNAREADDYEPDLYKGKPLRYFDALATFRKIMGTTLEDLDRDHADAIVADFIGRNCRKEDFVAYVKAAKKGLPDSENT